MKAKIFIVVLALSMMAVFPVDHSAANSRSSDLLRQGLLGAGAGAVGGAASGAKGGDVWKGALAGAGVNIVGGALLDSLSGEKVSNTQSVDNVPSRDAYSQGYEDGYQNGYKAGYTQGYKDGLREGTIGR
jgi:hypothetical protein